MRKTNPLHFFTFGLQRTAGPYSWVKTGSIGSRAPANREAGAGWPDYREDIYQADHAVRSSLLLPEALPIMKG
jgi:hypothetical protein